MAKDELRHCHRRRGFEIALERRPASNTISALALLALAAFTPLVDGAPSQQQKLNFRLFPDLYNNIDNHNNNTGSNSFHQADYGTNNAYGEDAEPVCSELCATVLPIIVAIVLLCALAKCVMTFCMPNWLRLRQRFNQQAFGANTALAPPSAEDGGVRRHSISIISELSEGNRGADSDDASQHQMTVTSIRQLDNDLIQQYLRCSYGEIFLQALPPSYDDAQKAEELQLCSAATTIASSESGDGRSRGISTLVAEAAADFAVDRANNDTDSVYDGDWLRNYYRTSVTAQDEAATAAANAATAGRQRTATASSDRRFRSPSELASELEERFLRDGLVEGHRMRIRTGMDSIPAPPDDYDDFAHCPPPPSYPNSARPSIALAATRGSVTSALFPLRKISAHNQSRAGVPTIAVGPSTTIATSVDETGAPPDMISYVEARRYSSQSQTNNFIGDSTDEVGETNQAFAEGDGPIQQIISPDVVRRTCDTIMEESQCHTETDSINETESRS